VAAEKERRLNIIIAAKNQADQALKAFGLSLNGVVAAAGVATAALAAVGAVISKAVAAASEQERADIKLAAALRTVGQNTKEVRDDFARFIDEMEFLTTVNDEAIASIVGTFAKLDIGSETAKRATRAILNYAAATGQDAVGASQALANILIKGQGRLTEVNTRFREGQSNAERFAQALLGVEKAGGITAEALGKTLEGALARVDIVIERALEDLGALILNSTGATEAINGFALAAEKLRVNADANAESVKRWAGLILHALAPNLAGVIDLGQKLNQAFGAGTKAGGQSLADSLGKGTKAAGDATDQVTSLDEALKAIGQKSLKELNAEATKLNEAFVFLTKARAEGEITQGQFDAISESLAKVAEQLKAAGAQVPAVFETATVKATELLSSQEALDKLFDGAVIDLEQLVPLVEEIDRAINENLVGGALSFSDTLIDAAFGAKIAWGQFFKQLLVDLAKSIARALILRALTAFFTRGAGAGTVNASGVFVGSAHGQHGGEVRGGIPGMDSVLAALTPGEVVLPARLRDDFDAITELAREMRAGRVAGTAAAGSTGIQILNRIEPARNRERDVADLIADFNEAVERRGFRLVASTVLA